MKIRVLLISFILLCGTCFAQNLHPTKDLAFGQIAAGGGYESVLTVTNRGTSAYSGTLELHTGVGVPWNPTINGVQVTNGQQEISLNPGETKTYKITLSGNTESAFGLVRSADLLQSSFIEGNMTYFVSAEDPAGGDPIPYEGVGVPPSGEFYKTTIPFEDVLTVALALANVNTGKAANVNLTVFSESNVQKGTKTITIGPNGHFVGFLWQQIDGLTGPGRLEIESRLPIFGTALTFVPSSASPAGSLFASLPLLASPYSYTFTVTLMGIPVEGEMGISAEGPFVRGYYALTKAIIPIDPPEIQSFSGELVNGDLQIAGYGTSALVGGGEPVGVLVLFENFDFSASSATGLFIVGDPISGSSEQGPISMTKKF